MASKDYARTERIAEQLRRELATILARDIGDPRLERVVISAVEVSKDLAHAKVFITLPDAKQAASAVASLKRASGYLKRKLAERMSIRSLPELRFEHDESLEQAMRLSELIDAAIADDEGKGG